MFQNIHIYYQIYDSAVDYKVGNETFSKKEKKKYGKPLELMMKIPKRGTLLFSSNTQHNNFNMTTYMFTRKRNMTTYNKLEQISKTFLKKKKKTSKKENNNPHAR